MFMLFKKKVEVDRFLNCGSSNKKPRMKLKQQKLFSMMEYSEI